jgi:hypothetical protein
MKLNRFYFGFLLCQLMMTQMLMSTIIAYPKLFNTYFIFGILSLSFVCIILYCFLAFPKEDKDRYVNETIIDKDGRRTQKIKWW